jgi:hypothetical protein
MKHKKSSCPFDVAAEVLGGEAQLRDLASSRAVLSIWRRQGVPWRIVGPRLLERWREATEGRGLVSADAVKHQAGAMLLKILHDAAKGLPDDLVTGKARKRKGLKGD